jgi:hypothetical protein
VKLFLIILSANLTASIAFGILKAAWAKAAEANARQKWPLLKWRDSKLELRTWHEGSSASYRVVLNLQTPARRRELRRQHEEWVGRMDKDYGMDFSHTL